MLNSSCEDDHKLFSLAHLDLFFPLWMRGLEQGVYSTIFYEVLKSRQERKCLHQSQHPSWMEPVGVLKVSETLLLFT